MKEEKVTQIIQAATTEFLAKGIDAASMQNIADLAEVSKRTLYKYYPSKEDLYFALIDIVLDRVEEMYELDFCLKNTIEKQMALILSKKIELTLNETFLQISRIIFGELLKGRVPRPEQMQRLNQSEMVFVNWIEAGQKAGRLSKNYSAQEIADQLHSILKGKIYYPILFNLEKKEELNLEKVQETVLNFFIHSFVIKESV